MTRAASVHLVRPPDARRPAGARRAGAALAWLLLLAACGGGAPAPAALEVAVELEGVLVATVTPASEDLQLRARPGDVLALASSLPVEWTRSPGPVTAEPAADATATRWSATLGLAAGEGSGVLSLTGTAQDGSGRTLRLRVTVTPPGAFETGEYPDLFVELLGVTPEQVQARIELAFQQLFHGDEASERIYFADGDDMAFIEDVLHDDVRSEGMSYGMMIAVQLDKRAEFDRLWSWARTYMQHQSGPNAGYFAWQLRPGPGRTEDAAHPPRWVMDPQSASDGEVWIATALLLASNRWGDGEGSRDYRAEAQRILDTMLHKEEQAGHGVVKNLFRADNHLVVFQPAYDNDAFTDPSYHVPHFYELWARWAARDNAFWCQAAGAARAYLETAVNGTTGLAPDYSSFDGTPFAPAWNPGAVNFRADAWRVAGNVGLDHLWFRPGPWHVTQSERLQAFFRGRSPALDSYGSSYTVDGTLLGAAVAPSTGLVAMNAAAALAARDAGRSAFVRALWERPIPTGPGRYYDGLLYLLGLLEVSGNLRVYHPAGGATTGCVHAAVQGR